MGPLAGKRGRRPRKTDDMAAILTSAPSPNRPNGRRDSCHILVGAGGYSYTEWSDAGFYPPGTKPSHMLPLYARIFSLAELRNTWYQMPQPEMLDRLRRQAPSHFTFTLKLTRTLTHDPEPSMWRNQVLAFRHGIAPLTQSGQLAAVLVQLAPGFDRSVQNRRLLASLLDELEGLPLAVEFLHGSWSTDRVFAELEKRGVTLVNVDLPDISGLFPPLDIITNPDLFYIRFHGRSVRGWRMGKPNQLYDYSYGERELREWLEKRLPSMAGQARRGVIVFNNYIRAQAPRNALTMHRLLEEYGFVPNPV